MADTKPINAFLIPSHVRLAGGASLHEWLGLLDRTADAAQGRVPDGQLTQQTFDFYRTKSLAFLKKNYP